MYNQLKTILLFGVLSALLLAVGGALAPQALGLFVVLALAMNLGAYFFSDRLVLSMYRARAVGPREAPELHALVRELAARAEVPMPRLYVVPGAQANAFATGRSPAHGVIAVTEGLLASLDARAIRGVLAHELAHIKNRDILLSTVAAILASVIGSIGQALSFGMMFGRDDDDRHPAAGLALAIVAPIAATLVQFAISRAREFRADEIGARISGDPEGLARALESLERGARRAPVAVPAGTASMFIVNPFGALATMARWFSTHPPVTERIARLRAMAPARGARAAYA